MNEMMNHAIAFAIPGEIKETETDAGWIQNANMSFRPTAQACLCLNSVWRDVACLIIPHMLKHTEQVAFTAVRGPQRCSPAQSQAPATFSLPGKFRHERI